MKKLIYVVMVATVVYATITSVFASGRVACSLGDRFNVFTGKSCFISPCQAGDLYDSQTGKLCAVATSTVSAQSITSSPTLLGNSVTQTQPVFSPTPAPEFGVDCHIDGKVYFFTGENAHYDAYKAVGSWNYARNCATGD